MTKRSRRRDKRKKEKGREEKAEKEKEKQQQQEEEGCQVETEWRITVDALEGSEVFVPEGTGELCHSCSRRQEPRVCSQYALQPVASVAHGEWE